jgi:hypothetical protein
MKQSTSHPLDRPPAKVVAVAIDAWRRSRDESDAGAPIGLIEGACSLGQVGVCTDIEPSNIAAEWSLGPAWTTTAGYNRFIALKRPTGDCRYVFLTTH